MLTLDRSQSVREADNALFQPAMQRTKVLAVIRQRLQRLAQNTGNIANTVKIALKMCGRCFSPITAGRRNGNQVTRKVAAVDSGNVTRTKRLQCVRMIPVVEMAAIFLHLLNGRDRIFDPLDGFSETDPAKLACRDCRQQINADVGWRCARGNDRLRRFLEVVRRQIVFLRRHEGFVVTPSPARDLAQFERNMFRHEHAVFGFSRLADVPGDGRRQNPQQCERNTNQECVIARQRCKQQAEKRNDRSMPHLLIITDHAALRAGLHRGSGTPFQHQLVADQQAIKRTRDGICHHAGGIGNEDDAQRDLSVGCPDLRPDRVEMRLWHDIRRTGDQTGKKRKRRCHEQRKDQQYLPDQRAKRVHEVPAKYGRKEPRNWRQRTTQVVDHLPAANCGHAACPIEDVRQKLPVATRPAMLPRDFNFVAGREILYQLDIGYQRAARKRAFEKVVAENGVLLNTALQRRFEGIHVIKALAGERPFRGQILIDVRHREDIGVDTTVDRKDALEDGGILAGCQRRRNTRLQQAVTFHDTSRDRIDHRTIDRMMHLADQLGHSVAHQARIGVQRHDVLDVGRHDIRAAEEGCILVAAQQHVQFMQLAALALPTHPAAFCRVIEPAAVQQIESRLAIKGITAVQRSDLALGVFENFDIVAGLLLLSVAPVAHQREIDFTMRVGEVMHLDVAHHFINAVAAGQHAGHGHQRSRIVRNTVLEFVSDQAERLHKECHQRVEETGCTFRSRQGEHQQERGNHIPGHSSFSQEPAHGPHCHRRNQKNRRRDRQPVEPAHRSYDVLGDQRPVGDLLFKLETTLTHQHGADIDAAV